MNIQLFWGTLVIALIMGGVFLYGIQTVIDQPDSALAPTPSGASFSLEQPDSATAAEVSIDDSAVEDDDAEEEDEDDDDDNTQAGTVRAHAPAPVASPPSPSVVTPTTPAAPTYTLATIAEHNSAASCYMAIRGKVYNITGYIGKHPGGNSILEGCGKDATAMFEGVRGHLKQKTLDILPGYYLGPLSG